MPRVATGQVIKSKNKKTGKVTYTARWKNEEKKLEQKSGFTSESAARSFAAEETLKALERRQEITAEQKQERREQAAELLTMDLPEIIRLYMEAHERGYDGAEPLRETTMKGYRKHNGRILAYFQHHHWPTAAGRIYRDDLLEAVRQRESLKGRQSFSRRTAKARYTHLKRICKFAINEGCLPYDPTDGVDIKLATASEKQRVEAVKREAVYTPDEIAALLQAADELTTEAKDARSRKSWLWYYRPLLHVLVHTGMRIGEARALTRADLDTAKRIPRIHVRQAADHNGTITPPKTANSIRAVPVTEEVLDMAASAAGRHNHDLIFASAHGTARADNTLRDCMLTPLCKHAGVKNRGFHAFRHYFASRHIQAGTQLLKLSKLLGHSDSAFTARTYVHLIEDMDDDEPVAMV